MSDMVKRLAVLLGLVLVGACSTPTIEEQPSGEFVAENLYRVQSSGFREAFVHRDAQLRSYGSVDIQPLDLAKVELSSRIVPGTNRRDWRLTPERETGLQRSWSEAMGNAFSRYGRATDGDKTLQIAARLTSILPGRPTSTTVGGALQPPGSTQEAMDISVEFRLYDLTSGDLLAVIRDTRSITTVNLSRTGSASIRQLFGTWASLLHTRVSGR